MTMLRLTTQAGTAFYVNRHEITSIEVIDGGYSLVILVDGIVHYAKESPEVILRMGGFKVAVAAPPGHATTEPQPDKWRE
jgi:hypothetical protein